MKGKLKPIIFLLVSTIIGIALLLFGIRSTYDKIQATKNYVSVEGKFIRSSIYSSDSDGTTYTLTYLYYVNGVQYTISTDYGSGAIPKKGTPKTIRYNPNNPSQAVISGYGSNVLLLVLGFMFTAIPLILIFLMFSNPEDFTRQKLKGVIFGLLFAIVGGSFYYMMCSGGDSLSIAYAFDTNGFWIIIPIMFVGIGIYTVIASLLGKININNYNDSSLVQNKNIYSNNEMFEQKVYDIQSKLENVNKLITKFQRIISRFFIIVFLIFWFGFLIISDFQAITTINYGGLQSLLISVIFGVAGIFVAYKNFKK